MAAMYVYMLSDSSRNQFLQGICAHYSELPLSNDCGLALFDAMTAMNRLVYFKKFDDLAAAQHHLSMLNHAPKVLKHKFVRNANPNWMNLLSNFRMLFGRETYVVPSFSLLAHGL